MRAKRVSAIAFAATFVLCALGVSAALTHKALAADPCQPVPKHFDSLIDRYLEAGKQAITEDGHETALDNARRAAIAGKHEATIAMVGIALLMRPRSDLFHLATLRQICGFAERNRLPLHVAACAYFIELNPLGNQAEKRAAVEREIERFAAIEKPPEAHLQAMKSLEACIATVPQRSP